MPRRGKPTFMLGAMARRVRLSLRAYAEAPRVSYRRIQYYEYVSGSTKHIDQILVPLGRPRAHGTDQCSACRQIRQSYLTVPRLFVFCFSVSADC